MEILLSLLLAVHLICVNLAAGGPLVAAWLDWRGMRGDAAAVAAARYLARHAILGLLAGALLGLTVGWLLWNPAYQSLWLGPLRYKLHVAGMEAVFSLIMLVGWYLWLPREKGGRAWAAAVRGLLAVLAATNLLYHFPPLFSVAARLYDLGQTAGSMIDGAKFRQLALEGETPALAVHVGLSSLAVAGVVLLGQALKLLRKGDQAASQRLAIWGGRWALAPTLLQLPVGLWVLATLPAPAQMQLMGASTAGTLLFVSAILAALWLARELASIAMGETARPHLIRAMAALLVTIVLMTAMQRQTRFARPASSAPPSTPSGKPA